MVTSSSTVPATRSRASSAAPTGIRTARSASCCARAVRVAGRVEVERAVVFAAVVRFLAAGLRFAGALFLGVAAVVVVGHLVFPGSFGGGF